MRRTIARFLPGICFPLLLAAPLAHPADAHDPGATAATASPATQAPPELQLKEVVVTARDRAESLQKVPVSADVVGGDAIAKQSLGSLVDLAETVPSVHISNDGAGGQMFIRGIGSGSNETFDQSVATFVDDIYHGSAHETAGTFLDVERVEILKGPQTTFFGNNAIAGAINVVTAKPTTDAFGGYARALYGQYGQYATEAALNIPVSDEFALRIAGNTNGMDGWQKNPYAGENQPNERNAAGRISALWRPNEDFDAILKIEDTTNKDYTGNVIGDCPPPPPFTAAGFCQTALSLGLPTGAKSNINTTAAGQGIFLDTFDSVLTANYHRWNQTFTSVSGYSHYTSTQNLDASATPQDLLGFQVGETYGQFSQELRITSPTAQPIEYLGGIYFQTDHTNGDPGALSYFFLTPTIEGIPGFAAMVPYLPLGESPNFLQDEQVYSMFAAATWHITDRLRLNAGIRQSWDRKDSSLSSFYGTATQQFGGIVPYPAALEPALTGLASSLLGAISNTSSAQTYSAFMPSAGIQYDFTPQSMAYFSYARGFKAGVPVTGFAGIESPPLQPEYVNAYELGVKTEWLQNRLLLNLDVFRSDYTNLQVSSTRFTPEGAPISIITNAASSRSQGVEFEGQWLVSDSFRIETTATYLDSRYTDYRNANTTYLQSFCAGDPTLSDCARLFPSGVPAVQNLSGQPTEFAPDWSGSVTGAYAAHLPGSYDLTTSLTAIYSSSYFFGNNVTDDSLLRQDAYTRLDGRLSLDFPDGRWSLDLIARNLTNAFVIAGGNGGTGLPTALGSLLLQREQPRNFALQARFRF
jgi:iron complex outermembrane recepter protein